MASEQQWRILLVEDNKDDQARVQALLSEIRTFQTELILAPTYAAALELLKHEAVEVILASDGLSQGAGMEFVREVQTRGYLMPIILLTAQGEGQAVDLTAMKTSVADYLEKDQMTVPLLERSLRYAIQRAQMLLELRELAVHDELTGLYNRREFYRMLDEEFGRCQRYNRTMVLLMCDIDRFKTMNEAGGRLSGDEVLRRVAQAMRKLLRAVDRLARYGSDEFAAILPETTGEAALRVAERLCQTVPSVVEAQLKAEGITLPGPLTLSVGMAELPGDADGTHMLIEKANQTVYAAKCQGGNKVVTAKRFRPG